MASRLAEAYLQIRAATDLLVSDLAAAKSLFTGAAFDMIDQAMIAFGKLGNSLSGFGTASAMALGTSFVTNMQSAFEKISGLAESVFSYIGGLASKIGLNIDLGAFVKSAATAEFEAVKLNTVINSTGRAAGYNAEQLKQMAKELAAGSIFSQFAIQRSMAMMLTFRNIQGETFKEAMTMVMDMATVFPTMTGGIQALKSATIQLGKALEDPVRGLAGLRRVGVTFSGEETKMIKTMQRMGNLAAAQQVIINAVNQQGLRDAAMAASNTFQGMVMRMRNGMEMAGAAVGAAILPILRPFVLMLSDMMGRLEGTGEILKDWGTRIGKALQDVFDAVKPKMDAIFKAIGPVLRSIGETFVRLFETIAGLVVRNPEIVAGFLTISSSLSILGLGLIAAGFAFTLFSAVAKGALLPMIGIFTSIGRAGRDAFALLPIFMLSALNPIGAFKNLFGSISSLFVKLGAGFLLLLGPTALFGAKFGGLGFLLLGPLRALMSLAFVLGPVAIGFFLASKAASGLAAIISELGLDTEFMTKLSAIWKDIKDVFKVIGRAIYELGAEIYNVISTAIGGDLWTVFKETAIWAIKGIITMIKQLTQWMVDNKESIAEWVTFFGRLAFAIGAVTVAVLALKAVLYVLGGAIAFVQAMASPTFLALAAGVLIAIGVMKLLGITVEDVFQFMESLVNDFALNCKIAWESIKYAFFTGLQAIEDGAKFLGAFILATLASLVRGVMLLFEPSKWKNYGAEVGKAFATNMNAYFWDNFETFGSGKMAAKVKEEMDKLINERRENIDKRNAERERRRQMMLNQGRLTEGGGSDLDMTPSPRGHEQHGQEKITFTGLTEQWKKIQESVSGGSMLALTKGISDNTGRTAEKLGITNEMLQKINENLKVPTTALVAPG